MRKNILLLSLLVAGFTGAQADLLKVSAKNIKKATPIMAARCIGNRIIGPWMPIHPRNDTNQNVPSYKVGFDATNTNPANVGVNYNDFFYGTPPDLPINNFYIFTSDSPTNYWRASRYADDCKMAPGTGNRMARFVVNLSGVDPGPNASDPNTALVSFVFADNKISNSNGISAVVDGGPGWAFAWQNPAVRGLYGFEFDWSTVATPDGGFSAGFSMPPQTGGGYDVTWGLLNINTNVVSQLPLTYRVHAGCAYPMAPSSQYVAYQGSNPSSTDKFVWWDSNGHNGLTEGPPDAQVTPNYIFDTSPTEHNNFDGGAFGIGELANAVGMWYDSNARSIRGKITHQGYSGPEFPVEHFATVTVSDGTNSVDHIVTYSAAGDYEVMDVNQAGAGGARTVSVKSAHWLSHTINVNTTAGSVTNANVSVKNGDVDQDNVVSIFDYIVMSDNFDVANDNPNWNVIPNPAQPIGPGNVPISNADVDHDGVVSIFDYIQLSDNFDLAGD